MKRTYPKQKNLLFGMFLCCIGRHEYRFRKNGAATEKICMRNGCDHREILQVRKDAPDIKIYQSKKSPRMKNIQDKNHV